MSDFKHFTEMLDWKYIEYEFTEEENSEAGTVTIEGVVFIFNKFGSLEKVEKLTPSQTK